MKINIKKTFNMEDNGLLYCETHDEHFSLIHIGEHIECEPLPYTDIKIPWHHLFHKCMNVKTGPNLKDIIEGKFSEKWSNNEKEREELFKKLHEQLEEHGWT